MVNKFRLIVAGATGLALCAGAGSALATAPSGGVTRATLPNGLRVVIVHDDLAPVVTTEMNYLVGADEVAKGFPGTAHAVEHMMFRGSPGLARGQLLAIASDMGGHFNADTKYGITQYYFTVPSQDLDVALHIAATRMRGVDMTEKGWKKERGAIEQEVARDHSNPGFKFRAQLQQHMFAGSPYAQMGLGTRPSFKKTTAARLKKFHDTWYAPNNAILVIAGDVEPASTLAKVKSLFGRIPRRQLPAKPDFQFHPMQAKTIKLPTDFPVGVVAKAWRMPGLRDKDYATALILSNALASKRGKLFAMGLTGKALFGTFAGSFMPHAGVGFAEAAFRRGGDAQKVLKNMEHIIDHVAAHGVSADLVQAAKQKTIADMEYKKNSVPGLANAWSSALANAHFQSPDDLRAAIKKVTPEAVNALANRVFNPEHAVTAILTPQSSGQSVTQSTFGKPETFGGTPSGNVTLPEWAKAAFSKLTLPEFVIHPSSFTLANGLRVIVQPERVSQTIEVFGEIKTNPDLQAPKGQKGVAAVLNGMFNFGTQKLPRLQFQAALDAISANERAGSKFSLAVPAKNFAKGMRLLAANELHPAMPQRAFMVMQHRHAGVAAGRIKSPGFLNTIQLDRLLLPKGDPDLRYATPKSIGGLSMADIKAYYRATFRPDMTTIVVIGDVTPAHAREVVQATFGSWKANGAEPDTNYPAVPANRAGHFRTPDKSAVQDTVTLTEMVKLTENSPERYAVDLGNEVLGSGFGSLLMHDLRVKHGLVYGVSSSVKLDKYRSRFQVSFGADSDKVHQARAMVIRDIKQMQTSPIDADALHAAKGKMLRALQLSQSSFGSIAGILLELSMEDKPLDAMSIAAQKYYKMDAAQIQSAFKKYVRTDGFVTAIKGPAPQA